MERQSPQLEFLQIPCGREWQAIEILRIQHQTIEQRNHRLTLSTAKNWLDAFRLRTLPLAFSSILLGAFLAVGEGAFQFSILLSALVTTLFLQILSNLANDYGDFEKGTDNINRVGPQRTVQTGKIDPRSMKTAIGLFSALAFFSGLSLLYLAGVFSDLTTFLVFLATGLVCIVAAITYTVGKNAYGYLGLGDVSVLLFFGYVGVLGTCYLMTHHFSSIYLLPATACGLLSVGVLNLNNLRDIENDRASGKNSIPVRIGFKAGKYYHASLIALSFVCFALFDLLFIEGWLKLSFLLLLPLYARHVSNVFKTHQNKDLDPFLKQLALTSLFSTSILGISIFIQ